MKNNFSINKKIFFLIFLLIFLFSISFFLQNTIDINFILNKYLMYQEIIDNNRILFCFFFIITFVLWISFFLPFITFFQIFSGFVFGVYFGTLVSIISILIGSYVIYLYPINKINISFQKNNNTNIENLLKEIKKKEFFYLLLIRVMPGVPFFLQNLLPSYLKVNLIKFLTSTIIGFLPICFLINFFGAELNQNIFLQESFEINFQKNKFYYLPIFILFLIYFLKNLIKNRFKSLYH